jgi:hypothetical protein
LEHVLSPHLSFALACHPPLQASASSYKHNRPEPLKLSQFLLNYQSENITSIVSINIMSEYFQLLSRSIENSFHLASSMFSICAQIKTIKALLILGGLAILEGITK